MIFFINFLFFFYILLIILSILGAFLLTPIFAERLRKKLAWTPEQKILAMLPLHLIFISLAISSVWKFQDWKLDYEIRTGHAQIGEPYRDFLENRSPELGKIYQKLIADQYLLEAHLSKMRYLQLYLDNHRNFIHKANLRWQMVLDQVKALQVMIEKQTQRPNDSSAIISALRLSIEKELQALRSKKVSIVEDMNQQAYLSIYFLKNPDRNSTDYPISEKNYALIINFFISKHDTLTNDLGAIIQAVYSSQDTINRLSRGFTTRNESKHRLIKDVLKEWKNSNYHIRKRLFRILYALETEYVLHKIGMGYEHTSVLKLQQGIEQFIPYYAKNINDLLLATKQSSNPATVLALY
jgi:hypothetical protein